MRVDVGGDGGTRVTEPLGDDLDVDPGLQCQHGPGVAKVVDSNAPKVPPLDATIELTAEPIGVIWPPVWVAEDEIVVLVARAKSQALLRLLCTP